MGWLITGMVSLSALHLFLFLTIHLNFFYTTGLDISGSTAPTNSVQADTVPKKRVPNYAVVTLITGSGTGFLSGAIALGQSLIDHHKNSPVRFDRIAMVTPDVDDSARTSLSNKKLWKVRQIAGHNCNAVNLQDPIFSLEKTLTWKQTCSKFAAWLLTEYDRIIFMDADMIVLAPITDAFHAYSNASFLAAPDVFPPDTFNSGFIVLTPNTTTYEFLVQANLVQGSVDGGDQSILNQALCPHWYFSEESDADCGKLPWVYNVNAGSYASYLHYQPRSGPPVVNSVAPSRKTSLNLPVHVVHFSGDVKPWTLLAHEYSESITLQNMPQKHRNVLISQAAIQYLWRQALFRGLGKPGVASNNYRLLGVIIEQMGTLHEKQV
jgi:alpha-N-acetylglucosamine transferase